jgi:hypothetical protein
LKRIFEPKREEVTGEWKNFILRSLISVLFTHYCAGDKIDNNEMGKTCSTYGAGERRVQGFGGKN